MSSMPSGAGGGGGSMPYMAIGNSIGDFISAGLSTVQRNKAVVKAANISFKRINDYITQARVNRLLETDQLSRAAQIEIGSAMNVAPEGQAAVQTIASRIVAGVAGDQFAIDEDLRRREAIAQTEKEDIKSGAKSQMSRPILAALQAAGKAWGANPDITDTTGGSEQLKFQAAAQQTGYEQQSSINEAERQRLITDLNDSAVRAAYFTGTLQQYKDQIGPLGSSPYVNSAAGQIFSPVWTPRSF